MIITMHWWIPCESSTGCTSCRPYGFELLCRDHINRASKSGSHKELCHMSSCRCLVLLHMVVDRATWIVLCVCDLVNNINKIKIGDSDRQQQINRFGQHIIIIPKPPSIANCHTAMSGHLALERLLFQPYCCSGCLSRFESKAIHMVFYTKGMCRLGLDSGSGVWWSIQLVRPPMQNEHGIV